MLRRLSLALAATLLLTALGAANAAASTFSTHDITARDGVVLKANLFTPDGPGQHPAIVFINSWGFNNTEYLAQAQQFADDGYLVLSYTTRGFYDSGGQIDVAGPKDIADLQDAIDWLLANTAADPAHIGASGISYGSGISLIGSAFDSRIRAVASMSTWTDLVYSLFDNGTRHFQSAGFLSLLGAATGRPSPELTQAMTDFFLNQNEPGLISFATPRSAKTYLKQIKTNKPAVFIANAYGDSIFAPNQLTDFFKALPGPKRLELRPGDHATPEMSGLLGQDNDVWESVHRWFDRYLRGVSTGIDTEPAVKLQVRGTSAYESYSSWSAVSSSTQSLGLSDVSGLVAEGDLVAGRTSGWSASIAGGVDTVADGGPAVLANGFDALTGQPPAIWVPSVSRVNGAVWESPPLLTPRRIRGAPDLRITASPSNSGQTTFIAYLYDTDDYGHGDLITHVPYTLRDVSAGTASTVAADFPATAYDVPAGHHLTLVIDTVDPLYGDAAPPLSSLTFSSPAPTPSVLHVPLR